MKNLIRYGYVLIALSLFASCIGESNVRETPTSGNIKIGVDESYQPMIEAQVDLFESIYQYAVINPEFGPEAQIIQRLLDDSVRCVITNRELNDKEMAFLNSKKIIPKTTQIAYDGLAFIVNKANPDSTFTYGQIQAIFTGKAATWNQLDPANGKDSLEVIFDNNASGNPRYIREKFKIDGKFPSNCFAVNSNEEVIKYVENNPGAMGIISVNWISDKNDTTAVKFLKSIKIAGLSPEREMIGEGPFHKPYQAYLLDASYPFVRNVYIINCETFAGLGSGFASFIAGEKGQRVILKSGLVPATMPIRLVQLKSN